MNKGRLRLRTREQSHLLYHSWEGSGPCEPVAEVSAGERPATPCWQILCKIRCYSSAYHFPVEVSSVFIPKQEQLSILHIACTWAKGSLTWWGRDFCNNTCKQSLSEFGLIAILMKAAADPTPRFNFWTELIRVCKPIHLSSPSHL